MKTFTERKEECKIAMDSAAEEVKKHTDKYGYDSSHYLMDRRLKEAYWRGAYNILIALERND